MSLTWEWPSDRQELTTIISVSIFAQQRSHPNSHQPKSCDELNQPIFEDIDLKRLASEQGWRGFDEKKFRKVIKEMDVQESQEELLWLLNS